MEIESSIIMEMDKKALYAAFRAHDTRFDGRFFVGISSTGIYCRPVCRAKTPLEKNCTFYSSAAAAELAGYRPCMTCRPELAPGHSGIVARVDAASRLAVRAASLIEENRLVESSLSELAERLGITDRHLRRIFAAEFGVSPVQYLQTSRLLLAKNLLTDTPLSATQVAMSSGFGSVRRFNFLFKKHYRLTPTELRKRKSLFRESTNDGVMVCLGYRPPYQWDTLLEFLAERAIPGVESVRDNSYRRTVAIDQGKEIVFGWISVKNLPDRNSLAVTLSESLLRVLPRALSKVRHLFDLNCDPSEIAKVLEEMNRFKPGLYTPGTRLPGCFDSLEMSVRAILGQQITVRAARTLTMRFADSFGEKIETPFEELTTIFPTARQIVALQKPVENRLGPIGITGARARSIGALASALESGAIDLSPQTNPETEILKLLEMPGIGFWTAQYIAMRVFGWPDAFPHTDYGVKKALKKALGDLSEREILERSGAWKPWRAYATISLWNSLQDGEKPELKARATQ
ncbi:MAG: helix-turn-helix domain-containing protein [Planctomycetaceae bacterium]|jgi:AraC family transcriptional regulator of adaptative response / DNA-3-methyladenine glycosylase II|nr:helix-turn-helix domain-containing protein [Planctomycetaceae bacterium]